MLTTAVRIQDSRSPIPVRVVKVGNGWQLVREGKPYLIKGAGGQQSLKLLVECGGNSIRLWGADGAGRILDEAQHAGVTVLLGIWLGHKDQGFHYDDPAQVRHQFEDARAAILKYRNHPALLAWGIGNEMEGYDKGDDPLVWKAVEDIARSAKELDPNHPTMTVIAEIGGEKLPSIARYCPDIDIVGVNSYGGAPSLPGRYRGAHIDKPYVLTEFGPLGQWEVGKTASGAPIEASSTEKAKHYRESYERAVAEQPGLCLGSYAFVWGFKQEATATWFGMLLPDGSKLGAVDTMAQLWSGRAARWPCPEGVSLAVDGPTTISPGATVHVRLAVRESNEDKLQATWVLQDEATVKGTGGSHEPTPQLHPEAILASSTSEATIRIPAKPGGYRLFVTVHNLHHGAATANIPLLAR